MMRSFLVSLLIFAVIRSYRSVFAQFSDLDAVSAIGRNFHLASLGFNASEYCSWPRIRCNSNQSSVELLDLSRLGVSGNLSLISELRDLKWLDLSYNNIRGSIPKTFGNLSSLQFLDLSSNKIHGFIPPEIGKLRNLRWLNLSNNLIEGEMPDELIGLENIEDFHVSINRITGSIPLWVGNLTGLRVFAAYENALNGVIPETMGLISEFELLNLHSNQIEGSIPESIFTSGTLQVLVLTKNRLTGSLPASVGNCKSLSNIRLGFNDLSGVLPRSIGNISSLTYFEANDNNFFGEVISEFSKCSNLTLLNLASNRFHGVVSQDFGELSNLEELILSGNSLSGEIPRSTLVCRNLNKLDLRNNQFNGTIPVNICNVSKLQYLFLGENLIRGVIPHRIGNCGKLLEFNVGGNYLSGRIPSEIGRLRNLQIALNLSSNSFCGTLPSTLGKLDKLVSLDVSNNRLSGGIPSELRGMQSLIEFNFSNNLFTGPIPAFAPFHNSSSSFAGNRGLCGDPLGFPCPKPGGSYHGHTHKTSNKVILVVISSGLASFVSVTVIVLFFMMREKQEKASKVRGITSESTSALPSIASFNVFVENLKQAIDLDAVITSTFKDENMLTRGTFSNVYKAVMPSGFTLFVRRLKSVDKTIAHHQNKVIRELEKLSRLFHDNLLRPIGFVIYEDIALLLHHHFPNGTLSQYLSHPTKQPRYESDWTTRLSIAIGVAEGLAYMHHVAIIHLDIASNNVFLDADFKPVLGEIEISRLLDPSKGTASSISAVAGSFGYIPPEYAYTMQVTATGNVYSYGVILLELLTTRLPVDEALGEGIDLVKWVHSASGRGETPEQILDPKLSTVSFSWRKEMLVALRIAMMCTDKVPARRPKMKKVVELLLQIRRN